MIRSLDTYLGTQVATDFVWTQVCTDSALSWIFFFRLFSRRENSAVKTNHVAGSMVRLEDSPGHHIFRDSASMVGKMTVS